MAVTKETDSYYLNKRNVSENYDPTGAYSFETWRSYFTEEIRTIYESLHEDLLYTDVQQQFDDAVHAFEEIDELVKRIGE